MHSWYTTKVSATDSMEHGKTIYKNSWYASLTNHQQPINTSSIRQVEREDIYLSNTLFLLS